MGCGSSSAAAAAPTAVLPSSSPSTPSRGGVHARRPSHQGVGIVGLPTAGPSAGTNPLLRTGSRQNLANGFLSSRRGTMQVASAEGELMAAGPNLPGLNPCSPDFFPNHMEAVWNHYARPPRCDLIDKAGLKQLAEDAVNSFLEAVRTQVQREHPKWKEDKVEEKVTKYRMQFLPGAKLEECFVHAAHYLAHELKFGPPVEGVVDARTASSLSGVTKPCFFLHFQRAHRCLFSFPADGVITLERELLVQKLNKQGVERANRSLKSLTSGKNGGGGGGSSGSTPGSSASGPSSVRGVKSSRASMRHKARRTGQRTSGGMFDLEAFTAPPTAVSQSQGQAPPTPASVG